jgi:hypothetical protein
MRIAAIVEGHGEVEAVPVLLRRLAQDSTMPVDILRPIRIARGKLVRESELRRAVSMAALRISGDDSVFIFIDADDDCPARLAPEMLRIATAEHADRRISVIVAKREFEAWYVAAATSLARAGKLIAGTTSPEDPEAVNDAKGWLSMRMSRRYVATIDQPAFAARFDLEDARRCPSFDKLVRDFRRVSAAP